MQAIERRVVALEARSPDDSAWRPFLGRPMAEWSPEALGVLCGQWCQDLPAALAAVARFTDDEIRSLYLEARAIPVLEERIAQGIAAGRLTPAAATEIRATAAEVIGPTPHGLNHAEFTAWVETRIARVEALFGDEAHVTD